MAEDPTAPDFSKGATFVPDAAPNVADIEAKVRAAATAHDLDPDWVANIARAESRFNPHAISKAGAYGVMQLEPGAAQDMGVNRFDLDQNITGGVGYLKRLYDSFGQDKRLATAAYNAGPGRVRQYGDVPPIAETRAYVRKVLGADADVLPDFSKGATFTPDAPEADATPDFSKKATFTPDPEPHPLLAKLGQAAAKAAGGAYADIADVNARVAESAKSRNAQAWDEIKSAFGPADYGGKDAHGEPIPIGPLDPIMDLPSRGMKLASGLFSGAMSWPSAEIDETIGRQVEAATKHAPSGRIQLGGAKIGPGGKVIGPPSEYVDFDTRMPKTATADIVGQLATLDLGGEAMKPGTGAVVDAKTRAPLTAGQEAFYKKLDPNGHIPPAQVDPNVVPPAGQTYVDMAGTLRQSSGHPDTPQPAAARTGIVADPAGQNVRAPMPAAPDVAPEPAPEAPAQAAPEIPPEIPIAPTPAVPPPAAEPPITPDFSQGVTVAGEHEFPGDRPAGSGQVLHHGDDIPFGDEEPAAEPPRTLIDDALDHLRDQRSTKPRNGPRLVDAIGKAGGLKDLGEEISDLRKYGARGGRLVNKTNGMSLDDAAVWAQERGYIGKPVASGERASIQELVDALTSDLQGRAVHSQHHTPEPNELVRGLARGLADELDYHGLDIEGMSNAEVRRALNDAMDRRDLELETAERAKHLPPGTPPDKVIESFAAKRPTFDPDQQALPGVPARNATAEAIAQERARRDQLRSAMGHAGPLFDETARAQADLFAAPERGPVAQPAPAPKAGELFSKAPAARAQTLEGPRGEISGLADSPAAQPIGRATPAKAQPLPPQAASVQRLAQRLRRVTEATVRQGRMGAREKGVLGIWNMRSGVARTKDWGELDVLSHEIGHDLSYSPKLREVRKAIDAHAGELQPLDYEPPDPKTGYRPQATDEGFAEWFRRYVTNPDTARAAAPQFTKAFEAAMARQNPKMLGEIQKIAKDYQTHRAAPAADRLIAAVHSSTPPHSPLGRFLARARAIGGGAASKALVLKTYGDMVGNEAEFASAVRGMQRLHWEHTGKALDLNGRANPEFVFRTMRVAAADAFNNMWHGVRGLNEEMPAKGAPSLRAALDHAFGKDWSAPTRSAFSAYLIARRLIGEWDRFAAGKIDHVPYRETRASLVQALADLDAQHPTFAHASDLFSDYTKAELALDHQSGLISDQAYKDALAERDFYAPLNRLQEVEEVGRGAARGVDDAEHAGGMDRFKGSLREFVDPVEGTIRRAMSQAAVRRFNLGVKSLKGLADAAGEGAGRWVEEVPNSEIKAYNEDMDKVIAATAKRYGVDPEDIRDLYQSADMDIQPDDRLTLFRREPTKARGEPLVFYWEGGARHAIRLVDGEGGKLMLEFMAGANKELQAAFNTSMGKLASAGTGLLRFGVTGAPAWAITNFLKDSLDVWLKVPGTFPLVTTLSGLKEIAFNTDIAKSYERFGRIKGGVVSDAFEHARLKADVKSLKARGMIGRHFASPLAIARMAEFSELGTRVGVYKVARKQALKRGLSPVDAAFEASNVAADYMPFDRAGRKTQAVRKWVAFANAWAQGLDSAVRTAVPGTALAKLARGEALTQADKTALYKGGRYWALMLGVPTMLSLWQESLYHDDPEYQEVSPYFRATHWVAKADDIGIPKALQGWSGKWVRFPKPFEHAVPGNILERQYERVVDHDPNANAKMLDGLWQILGPPNSVFFVSPYMQMKANRDINGKPIIPEHLMGAGDPELKVNSYTSDFSKAASHLVGNLTEGMTGSRHTFSPAMADFWITSMTGSQGRDFLSESSRAKAALTGKPQPALGPEDEYMTSRFAFDNARSSQSSKDFWGKVGKDDGTYTAALNDFTELQREKPDQAIASLAKLPADVRDYVLANKFGPVVASRVPGGASKLHPVVRAQAMVTVLSDLKQNLRDDSMADEDGPIRLTPQQRKTADDALTHLGMAEMRDALIMAQAKGYANRQPMDVEKDRAALAQVDPRLLARLDSEAESRHIPDLDTVREVWPDLRDSLREMAQDDLRNATQKMNTRGLRGKYDELIRQNAALLDNPQ